MTPRILFVIGASGAGKTAAVEALASRNLPQVKCYFFDHIGVPSPEEMHRDFGGGEQWQAHATTQWVDKLASQPEGGVAVLDGQTRPTFIAAALAHTPAVQARTVLLDCTPDVRATRLAHRGQPELATAQMNSWAAYLRGQADALGIPVIDTSEHSIDHVAGLLEQELTRFTG